MERRGDLSWQHCFGRGTTVLTVLNSTLIDWNCDSLFQRDWPPQYMFVKWAEVNKNSSILLYKIPHWFGFSVVGWNHQWHFHWNISSPHHLYLALMDVCYTTKDHSCLTCCGIFKVFFLTWSDVCAHNTCWWWYCTLK